MDRCLQAYAVRLPPPLRYLNEVVLRPDGSDGGDRSAPRATDELRPAAWRCLRVERIPPRTVLLAPRRRQRRDRATLLPGTAVPVKRGGTLIRGDDLARFFSKTERRGDCLVWVGSVDDDGYGKFTTGPHGAQKHHRPHRWIYERVIGPLDGALLRHSCDNPPCVEVRHLLPGTQLENVHDALDRGRRRQKMTTDLVIQARAIRSRGESVAVFAASINVSYHTVYAAAVGKTWRHVK